MTQLRYNNLSAWLKKRFNANVRKLNLDAALGCPNRDGTKGLYGCTYCNPRGAGSGAHRKGLSIEEQVDRGIGWVSKKFRSRKFIAYFQSFTNTYAPLDRLEKIYSAALKRPEVVGLAIGTRPDCVDDDVLDLLASFGKERLIWIEYGLQSANPETLKRIRRGHGPEAFFEAVEKSHRRNLLTVAHMILGLPGETMGDYIFTARAIAKAGVWGIKIHPLYVVRGSSLESEYSRGDYIPLTEEQARIAAIEVLRRLPPEMVIHRLTSDPHPEDMLAPKWMHDKEGVRERLLAAMDQMEAGQGDVLLKP
jgi:hypothetical protein